mmetsp:Transcript_3404/g.10475  ORF Transcript_3404/g.10475 Transcript_3404/m.10475 type:complete len:238 (+) Transcript_3404:217-930(+)
MFRKSSSRIPRRTSSSYRSTSIFKRLIFFVSPLLRLKTALDKVTHGTVSVILPRDNHLMTKKQIDLMSTDLTKNKFFSKTYVANVFILKNVGTCFIINAQAYSTTFKSVSFSSSIAVDHPAAFGNDVNEIESFVPSPTASFARCNETFGLSPYFLSKLLCNDLYVLGAGSNAYNSHFLFFLLFFFSASNANKPMFAPTSTITYASSSVRGSLTVSSIMYKSSVDISSNRNFTSISDT